MSIQITTAMVESYKSNVKHLTQQKGSKLRRAVQVESVNAKSHFFEQIGATSMRQRTSRHADTPRMDVPHARRRVTLTDYDWAELVDNEDKVRMLIDPTSPYAEAAAMAAGREIDKIIITAADATAYTGVDGSTTTSFDTNMVVDVQVRWPGVSADDCGLNVAKILAAAAKLGSNDVDPDEEKYLVPNARQIQSLLMDEKISSHDFNVVKPLVEGQVVRFGGFTIIPCNRITTDANGDDKVLYWAKGGLALGVGADITTKISERPDKNYATQVFCSMIMGATRLEEARVGYIECDPDGGPTGALD
jgi:hypothetical protein